MAVYKVIQDIEAEDKLLGPFGLRQFIYLIIVCVCLFVMYKLIESGAWFIALPILPFPIFFGALALPIGGEQPTETWLLAKVRFYVKPRRRIWDQTGQLNPVTITVPKKIEKVLTKNLSQAEVRSRLEALANTIDSRGWAVKNVNVNLFSQPTFAMAGGASDRLLDAGAVTTQAPSLGVTASDDILDEQNNPKAQNLDRMISEAAKAHREKIISNMKQKPISRPRQDQSQSQSRGQGQSKSQSQPSQLVAPDEPASQTISSNRPDPTKIPIINDSNLHPFRNVTYGDEDGDGDSGSSPAAPPATPAAADDNTPPDYWFMHDAPTPPKDEATFESSVIKPDPSVVKQKDDSTAVQQPTGPLTEEELLEKIHEEKKNQPHNYGNLRVIKPIEEQKKEAEEAARKAVKEAEALAEARAKNEDSDLGPFAPTYASPLDDPINSDIPVDDTSVTQAVDPDIIELANNDDLNVETIARQAKKSKDKDLDDGEVVINLH